MDNKQLPSPYAIMVLACFIGMGIMSSSFEDGFSITTYYLGLGVTLVGASMKLFTKPENNTFGSCAETLLIFSVIIPK